MAISNQNAQGLYQRDYEHDACGVGMIVNIHAGKSHELVDNALHVLENMRHRGAEVGKDGDGAGIMIQIPHEFILLQGIPVPEKGKYGTGLVFLPKEEQAQSEILSIMIEEIEREGLQLMHLRTVPTNPDCLGERSRSTEPAISSYFIYNKEEDRASRHSSRFLYLFAFELEHDIQGNAFIDAGATVFHRPEQSLPDQWIGAGTFTFQHQHLPHMVVGTAFPSACSQWRDQYHPWQSWMDAGPRVGVEQRRLG